MVSKLSLLIIIPNGGDVICLHYFVCDAVLVEGKQKARGEEEDKKHIELAESPEQNPVAPIPDHVRMCLMRHLFILK